MHHNLARDNFQKRSGIVELCLFLTTIERSTTMRNYCFVVFLVERIKERHEKLKLQKKQYAIGQIEKNWTDEEVKLYNTIHAIDGNNSGFALYNKENLPLHILEENKNLFTKEEYSSYTRKLRHINY